jgi:hypothetical protein
MGYINSSLEGAEMTVTPRRADRNIGGVVSRNIPDDRYIVGAVIVLMDDDGNFSTYIHEQPPMASLPSAPAPTAETLMDLGDLVAQAWALASIQPFEE